jgi:hypothetical protein
MKAALGDVLPDSVSLAASLTTDIVKIDRFERASFQLAWTGTPTGNWTLEYSNDAPTDGSDPVNWTTVAGTISAAGGAAGNLMYDFETAARYARAKYTFTSGTGTLTVARFSGKETH